MLAGLEKLWVVSLPPAASLLLGVIGSMVIEWHPLPGPDDRAGQLGRLLVQPGYFLARVGVSAAFVSLGLYVAIFLRRELFPRSVILQGPWFYWVSWGVGNLGLCALLVCLLRRVVSHRKQIKRRFAVACVQELLLGSCPMGSCTGCVAPDPPVPVVVSGIVSAGAHSARCTSARALRQEVDVFSAKTRSWFGSYAGDSGYLAAGMIGFLWALLAAHLVR